MKSMSFIKRVRRWLLFTASRFLSAFFPRKFPLVLLYHSIQEHPSRVSVSPSMFEDQMVYLKRHGYTCRSTLELLDPGARFGSKDFILHFDDGFEDNLNIADPILKKYGFTASIFIAVGHIGGKSEYAKEEASRLLRIMSEADIAEMERRGHMIGNHFFSHTNLTDLNAADVTDDYERARQVLEKIILHKETARIVAYPRGRVSKEAVQVLETLGVRLGFAVSGKAFRPNKFPFQIPRVEIDGQTSMERFRLFLESGYAELLEWFS